MRLQKNQQHQSSHHTESNRGLKSLPAVPVLQMAKDPANKVTAQEQHLKDQERVYDIIDKAAAAKLPSVKKPTREKLLKNTAELIKSNFARLVVMSRTHADPSLRNENEVAYFDLNVSYPAKGGDYNLAQDDHIYMAPADIQGHADHRGEIRFYDPSDVSDENLKTVLIHEMQHQADYHNPNEAFQQPAIDENAGVRAVNGYQTEFRAYWLGGIFRERKHLGNSYDALGFSFVDAANDRKVPSGSLFKANFTTAFKNRRQENIFWHLVGSTAYTYVLQAYQNSPDFREMVHNFSLPSGGNLLNSSRIDTIRKNILTYSARINSWKDHIRSEEDFEDKEEYRRISEDREGQATLAENALRISCLLLDREDLEFLNDRTSSAPFWNFVQEKTGGIYSETLYGYITGRKKSIDHTEFLKSLNL